MPELPEVETVLQGLKPHLEGAIIQKVTVRESRLRWPVPEGLDKVLCGKRVGTLVRRGKYLLMPLDDGALILHLGMSGSLRLVPPDLLPEKHDHVDMVMSASLCLRYTDPRRFGAILWVNGPLLSHPLLCHLGPEPLEEWFTSEYLEKKACGRRTSIKSFIMDSRVVTGIGNIYAAEALFLAGVHPLKPAGELDSPDYARLVDAIREVLRGAIREGGTTLKDFVNSEGKPGDFYPKLQVYGRGGLPCTRCQTPLISFRSAQRSTVYCECCQK